MSESPLETRRLLRPAAALVFLIGAALSSTLGGAAALLLFLAAGALSLTIFFLWNSLHLVDHTEDMDFEEALALAAPSATEEQKRAVLRTLKDLEYELSVGKISQQDFEQVSAEYRKEAKRLIHAHDEEMRQRLEAAEELLKKHVEPKQPTATKPKKKSRPRKTPKEEQTPDEAQRAPEVSTSEEKSP